MNSALTEWLESEVEGLDGESGRAVREELRELQLFIIDEMEAQQASQELYKASANLIGYLGDLAESKGVACLDEYSEDPFLYGYKMGLGSGWLRASRLLAFLGNMMKIKMHLAIGAQNG